VPIQQQPLQAENTTDDPDAQLQLFGNCARWTTSHVVANTGEGKMTISQPNPLARMPLDYLIGADVRSEAKRVASLETAYGLSPATLGVPSER
jgi:hypothetical protein